MIVLYILYCHYRLVCSCWQDSSCLFQSYGSNSICDVYWNAVDSLLYWTLKRSEKLFEIGEAGDSESCVKFYFIYLFHLFIEPKLTQIFIKHYWCLRIVIFVITLVHDSIMLAIKFLFQLKKKIYHTSWNCATFSFLLSCFVRAAVEREFDIAEIEIAKS